MNKFGFLLLIIFTSSLLAQNVSLNISKMNYGNQTLFQNARSLGMGGSGIADGSSSSDFLLNPALGALSQSDISVVARGHLNKYQEDRSFPYYDSFGGFVDYGSYVFNENWYNDYSGSINYMLPEDLAEGFDISIAIAVNPFMDFNYDYIEEVRSSNFGDAILAYNKIQSEGVLQNLSFNAATKLLDQLAFGLQLGIISGEINQSEKINPVDSDIENIRGNWINNINLNSNPLRFDLGLFYQPTEFLSLGSRISLPYTLEFQNDFSIEYYDTTNTFSKTSGTIPQEIEYPLSFGFGLNYKFTNILLARLNFDFEYTFWSDIRDDLNPGLRFDDTYRFKVGVEHIFMDKVPFRLGFNYAPLRENKNITQTIFTAGTGMVFDDFKVELSGGISSLIFNQIDMYDNALYGEVSRGEEALDRVESDSFYGMIEINYFLDL